MMKHTFIASIFAIAFLSKSQKQELPLKFPFLCQFIPSSRLWLLNCFLSNRPIENKYVVVEFNGSEKLFEKQVDALIFLIDNGLRRYQFLI
jgi:uncharacterized membrane protein